MTKLLGLFLKIRGNDFGIATLSTVTPSLITMRLTIFLIFFFLWNQVAHGQSLKNLVFEGGGMRGISYAGALAELEQRGLLTELEKVGGTSVGAIDRKSVV